MKNKILLFLFFVLCNFKVISQAYHPLIEPNKYWQVMSFDPLPICGVDPSHEYFFSGDTILGGVTYKKIYSYNIISLVGSWPLGYCNPFAVDMSSFTLSPNFLREDTLNRKVYIYYQVNNSEQLYLDFSLNDGDSLISAFFTTVIDSVRPFTLNNGTTTKIFYLQNGGKYIEGVGGTPGGLFGYIGPSVSPPADDITCIIKNNIQLYNEIGWYGCIGTVGLQDLSNEQNLSIKFNNDLLSINSEIDKLQLIVYDTNGKNCYQSKITKGENSFTLNNLSVGCYLVKVFDAKEQKTKFISIND